MDSAIEGSGDPAESVGFLSLNAHVDMNVTVEVPSDVSEQATQDESGSGTMISPPKSSPSNSSQIDHGYSLVTGLDGVKHESSSEEEVYPSNSDMSTASSSDSSSSSSEGGRRPKGKTYTGKSSKMKYFIRKPFAMTQEGFAKSGERLLRRRHIIDLRCPDLERSGELSEVRESEFDAIRINSWPILKALVKIPSVSKGGDYSKASVPYVFSKPFTFLIDSVDEVEEYVQDLREKRKLEQEEIEAKAARKASKPVLPGGNAPDTSPVKAGAQEVDTAEPDSQKQSRPACPAEPGSPTAKRKRRQPPEAGAKSREPDDLLHINDVEYYIKFVRENLKAELEKRRKFQAAETKEIAFEDLHQLFRPLPNEYVVSRINGILRSYQVAAVTGGGIRGSEATKSRKSMGRSGRSRQKSPTSQSVPPDRLEVHGFYIDFDGKEFCPCHEKISIDYFEGTQLVRGLPLFPYNYLTEDEKEFLNGRGAKFLDCAQGQKGGRGAHRYHSGMTIAWKGAGATREELDSTIIVDHVLGIQYDPSINPNTPEPSLDLPSALDFLYSARSNESYWSSGGLATTWSDNQNRESYQEQFRLARKMCTGSIAGVIERLWPLRFLGDRAVLAYALRTRKWVCLDVSLVTDFPEKTDGFDSLVLPDGHKELVKALVQMHSQTSDASAVHPEDKPKFEFDLVQGKGKGLLVLLHGAPGVGKTSTAECVADYTKRPLYSLTCGDIGYEPTDVAKNLEENFRMAHKWGCVLLLDEADVFLAKRDRQDLKRNSLVSIFLRVLEYYSGILFLTTNRVGIFDEAFKSRIHMSLYYPPLDKQAYLAIWEMNLNRIVKFKPMVRVEHEKILTYANKSFEALKWNGRQIRNAVQTALALAEYRAKAKNARKNTSSPDVPLPTVLDKRQFEKVAKAAKEFDKYLVDIYGGADDTDLAREQQLRADPATPRPTAIATEYNGTGTYGSRVPASATTTKRSLFAESEGTEDSQGSDSSSDDSAARAKKERAKEKEKEKEKKKRSSSKKTAKKESKSKSRSKSRKKKVTESEAESGSDSDSSRKESKSKSKSKKFKKKETETEQESGSGSGDSSSGTE